MHDATRDAGAFLAQLAAEPRPAGGEAERVAREACVRRLAAAGFGMREAPFEYSAFPGRWATPLSGAMLAGTFAAGGHFGFHGSPATSVALALLGAAAIAVLGLWSAKRGVLDVPLLRARGVNLVATRGDAAPRVWLVAHLDSKSQPVPMAARAAGITVASALWIVLVACAASAAWGEAAESRALAAHGWGWIALTLAGIVALLPVMASTVGARSPGAVDNASGVASVVLAAEALPPDLPVAVLLTSAEELGLAGARAWAAQEPLRPGEERIAINCDGVDDAGALTVMLTGRGSRDVAAALVDAARAEGVPMSTRRLLPGVLVDAVALADAGWRAATVSRGTIGTLLRIHGERDTAAMIDGRGIAEAARVIARAAQALARPER